jgi:hypothetical protein
VLQLVSDSVCMPLSLSLARSCWSSCPQLVLLLAPTAGRRARPRRRTHQTRRTNWTEARHVHSTHLIDTCRYRRGSECTPLTLLTRSMRCCLSVEKPRTTLPWERERAYASPPASAQQLQAPTQGQGSWRTLVHL